MDDWSEKKSSSLETLVIQNNVNDLKSKLHDIIKTGKDYNCDVFSCLKSLLNSSDHEIVLLTVQAISELAKCCKKRETYAHEDIIKPLLSNLHKDLTSDSTQLIKQSCRSLGNLCCDCDVARKIVLDNNGVEKLKTLLDKSLAGRNGDLMMFTSKALLNFVIGGREFSEPVVQVGLIPGLCKILKYELEKENSCDHMISTVLLILSVVNDNSPEFLFEQEVNVTVLNVLRETVSLEVSELCLDHLHAQAEHDSVKTLLANENGVQVVCSRLEQLVQRQEAGELQAEAVEVEAIVKQACDLIIIVLTGDEAMHILYNNGQGAVYKTVVQWLDSPNCHLLTTALLAIGNCARQDDYCVQLMQDGVFDKLLDIFEVYHVQGIQQKESGSPESFSTITKIETALLSALRNLTVTVANKRVAAGRGRAAPVLMDALPSVEDHQVAYRLLATIRMLVDGQESVAVQLASRRSALEAVVRWGGEVHVGAGGEAPRLIAWAVKALRGNPGWTQFVEVEGCISSLVNMLVVGHSVMQNEAILALTILALETLQSDSYEHSFVTQLVASELGLHVSVLIETNCAKMPLQVAENLLAFLDITAKKNKLAMDYKKAKVVEALQKFCDARNDLGDNLKAVIANVVKAISDLSETE